MASLCVNIDHIATLRQARRGIEPDPVHAVGIVEMAGSTGVTVHLREDQRHIQERDVQVIRRIVQGHLNLEMAATQEMVDKALSIKPHIATLVPERREEVTTEGGLNVADNFDQVREATDWLVKAGITVSLFIDADARQVEAAANTGASDVEFHTGSYCHAVDAAAINEEYRKIVSAAKEAQANGLIVHAGHGLNYKNVRPIAAIEGMHELNIGHAIISRAIFSGLQNAVTEMAGLINEATRHADIFRLK